MGINITSLTGNGLKDWMIQRLTALYLAGFACVAFVCGLMHPIVDYQTWVQVWQCPILKISSFMALVCFVLHAWIGLWTVTTDYLKSLMLRGCVQLLIFSLLTIQFLGGTMMIWGQ